MGNFLNKISKTLSFATIRKVTNMWGSFKQYLGQYYSAQEHASEQSDSEEIEKNWVFVDNNGNEVEKTETFTSLKFNTESRLNPLPLLDISNTSTPQSSPQLSPTKIEEGWFVAPPPCFTKNSTGMIEKSPLEDLLIEHPSMSVYAQVPGFQTSFKKTDDHAETSSQIETSDTSTKRTNEPRAEQGLLTVCTKPKMNCSKSQHDLKSLVDQVENTKPAQQAKWENDQYKLCPSYMSRQNRVHRYQSRKHHNQKKKSIAKPFAEKGRHF
ncbi:trp53inp1 [Trichonephila clavata]|uniref:Trp53inp1 n=1 Tax=Trichonephila clavata TaxID=2740835 RepID=A0A8X6L2S4_TRICU|nr:trp53inp1 [Trichonephila clavata]